VTGCWSGSTTPFYEAIHAVAESAPDPRAAWALEAAVGSYVEDGRLGDDEGAGWSRGCRTAHDRERAPPAAGGYWPRTASGAAARGPGPRLRGGAVRRTGRPRLASARLWAAVPRPKDTMLSSRRADEALLTNASYVAGL